MLLGIFLISLGAFLVGFLAALHWMDFAWAELLELRKDKTRLDWIEDDLRSPKPVIRIAFRGYFDAERKFWIDCQGPVRRMIDSASRATSPTRRAA